MKWRWKWSTTMYRYPFYERGEQEPWTLRLWGLSVFGLHFGVSQIIEGAPGRAE